MLLFQSRIVTRLTELLSLEAEKFAEVEEVISNQMSMEQLLKRKRRKENTSSRQAPNQC